VYYESPAGGNGGFAGGDGPSAFVNIDFGNLPSIHNVESIENEMPLLVEGCTLRIDGGGEGEQRGGVGMIRQIRLLDEEASYSVLSDRAVIPPWGVHGGSSGAPYHLSVARGGAVIEFDTPGKVTGYPVYRDDVVVMRSSGGGGYGDPLQRNPALVRQDVTTGHISADRAAAGYGVVIDAQGQVDATATDLKRASLRHQRFHLRVVADDTIDAYVGAKGKRRIVQLSSQDASILGVHQGDLVELRGANPAPLRAWVQIGSITPGEVRLDAFARRVLRCGNDDVVELRPLSMPKLPKGMAG
jgi:N-methylhydantoinase B